MTLTYTRAEKLLLKSHPQYTEVWVRDRIAEDTSILGLGELEVRAVERSQPSGGRLDLLLVDPDSEKWYEVELMLGAVDESHIIRTIEYWDTERKRYPQYDHVAVLVAEDITTRFLNVISLFNSAIPLIAIQLNALQVGNQMVLHFTKVLDEVLPGDEETDSGSTDHAYWEKRAPKATLAMMDECLDMLTELDASTRPRYVKRYIGVTVSSYSGNIIAFRPRKQFVGVSIFVPEPGAWKDRFEEAGFSTLPISRRRFFRFQIRKEDMTQHRELLVELFSASYQGTKD